MRFDNKYIGKVALAVMLLIVSLGMARASENIENSTEVEAEKVKVVELDLGDYSDIMIVGERQLLTITVLPFDATDTNMIFTSTNVDVASVNGLGRITANKVGTTTIKVECDGVEASFILTVIKEENSKIPVKDIEISDYEDEISVDETVTLSTNVLPADASDCTVTYKSSNTFVATVNSSGEVKGISSGSVTIYITAGSVTKQVLLTVKEDTASIDLNSNYLVLAINEEYQLQAKVMPEKANQNVSFRSVDSSVATVSDEGNITATGNGSTSIIVTNGDYTAVVSVIVNSNFIGNNISDPESDTDLSGTDNQITNVYNWTVVPTEKSTIDENMLKQLYITQETLYINGQGYTMELRGEDILNYKNVLYTDLSLIETQQGTHFSLNQGKELCGKITLKIDDIQGRYLYLYNESKDTYEMLKVDDFSELELSTAGEYLITREKIKQDSSVVKYSLAGAGVFIFLFIIAYVFAKKKHWFW